MTPAGPSLTPWPQFPAAGGSKATPTRGFRCSLCPSQPSRLSRPWLRFGVLCGGCTPPFRPLSRRRAAWSDPAVGASPRNWCALRPGASWSLLKRSVGQIAMKIHKNPFITGAIATGILMSNQTFGSEAAWSQQAEYRFPPATPVTCKVPQRGEIFKSARSFYIPEGREVYDDYYWE